MTNTTQAPSPPEFPKEDKMNKSTKITALYERLSVEDGVTDSESNSIQTQKLILEEYAKAHGLTNIRHYTDDGISGLRFDDRPGYVQMMEDIESGKVAVCCIKDISRLGRDHIRVGLCMEIMRQNNVRLIGVTDGIDTAKGEDDFTPFRAIMHEFYAKDCSKKIKSAFKAKGMSGKPHRE
jgi:DNA invertase Pin-like site-specific DNA recombinase